MPDTALSRFLDLARGGPPGGGRDIFNPWRDRDPDNDLAPESPDHRLEHLRRYMEARRATARILCVAEAPGYAGCKFSDLAMSSERDLIAADGLFEDRFFDGPRHRTSRTKPGLKNASGMLERTATIVWEAMLGGGFGPREFVLWNSHAWHPHQAGNRLSNRTPAPAEVEAGLPVLQALRDAFPGRPLLAIGQVCQRTLRELGIDAIAVRHPSYGGAPEFRARLATLRHELD